MTATAPVLSAQEEAIQGGKKTLHDGVTDRVLRLFEAIHPNHPPRVALERAALFTESFKETEGQPHVHRWANALFCTSPKRLGCASSTTNSSSARPNTWLGRWAIVYPELDGSTMPPVWRCSAT